ncbi:hypothetical protein BXM09_22135 [Salmonella enterica subsp. enterica serovar Schwarzengrund]|nr:hypothetical protein [Salmonella enterica subsp. enterica serovar Schwarzengrund]
MNKTTRRILEQIARQINHPGMPPKEASITLTSKRFEYYFGLSIKERLTVHEELQVLFERYKCATVLFGPVALGEVASVHAIDITRPRLFLEAAGVQCLYDEIERACKQLALLRTTSDWLQVIIDKAQYDWRQGRQAYGVKPCDIVRLTDAIRLLDWLGNNEQMRIPDIRTLSVVLFNDTKRIEAISGIIVRLYRPRLPEYLLNADNDQILDFLGIRKFSPLIRFKGSFKVVMASGSIDCTDVSPYIGFPPDAIKGIHPVQYPGYILFIENETTFNRYTRDIIDNGWVIYTNGFPSRSWTAIFRELVIQSNPGTPVYHWGDIDIGGYRILVHMQSILGIDLHPFRMLPTAEQFTDDETKLISVNRLHSIISDVDSHSIQNMAKKLLILNKKIEYVPWVEQERLKLVSPQSFENSD